MVKQCYTQTKQCHRCLFKCRYSGSAMLQRFLKNTNKQERCHNCDSSKFTHELNHYSWIFPTNTSLLTRFSFTSNGYSVTPVSSLAHTSIKAVIKFQYNRDWSPVCSSSSTPDSHSFLLSLLPPQPSSGIEYSNMAAHSNLSSPAIHPSEQHTVDQSHL